MRIAEIVAQHLDGSLSNSLLACLDLVAFDKPFDRFCVYTHLDYWVKETIFGRQLKARGGSCCFINLHCIKAYAITPFVFEGKFSHPRLVALL